MTADRCKMEGRLSTGPAPTAEEQGLSPSPASTTEEETGASTPDRGLKDAPTAPTKCRRSDSESDVTNNNVKSKVFVVVVSAGLWMYLFVFATKVFNK